MTPQQVDVHTFPFECTAREDGLLLEAHLGHGCRRVGRFSREREYMRIQP